MDLSQAEGVNDLINATDEVNAKSAMHSLKGSVSKILKPLEEDLTQIISNIEVNIDYPEYDDVHQLTEDEILPKAKTWLKDIQKLIDEAKKAVNIREGIDTVILGRPNVGKSSLLNALLEEDKAIVTDGALALEILDKEYIDLIISDIMMPVMDGYELVSELRSAGYQIPVLMITAKGSFDDMRQGFLSGSDDFM